jgi:hypothetical protein
MTLLLCVLVILIELLQMQMRFALDCVMGIIKINIGYIICLYNINLISQLKY